MSGRDPMIGSGRQGPDEPEMHEINVTPMIDVMLVLLIIFMVAAPLATVEAPVTLPALAAGAGDVAPGQRPLVLTLREDGSMMLGGDAVDPAGLAAALESASGGDRARLVYLLADAALPYGRVMATMGAVRSSGFEGVSLVALEQQ